MVFPSDPLGFSSDEPGSLLGVVSNSPDRQVHLPDSALRRHLLLLGRSGAGKSVMLRHILAQKLQRRAAGHDRDVIVVIDPDGGLVRDLLELVPASIASQIQLLDFGGSERVPVLNLLDPLLFPDRDRAVDVVVRTFRSLWHLWDGRMEEVLRFSLMIFHEFNSHPNTIREDVLTILDVPDLLLGHVTVGRGDGTRYEMGILQRFILSRVSDPALKLWFTSYLAWSAGTRTHVLGPLQSGISALGPHRRVSAGLGYPESTVALDGFLEDGRVLLASTGRDAMGVVPAALMGGALVSLVGSELRAQARIPSARRNRCLLVCEDFQSLAGPDWLDLLSSMGRHMGSLLLSSQSLQVWDEKMASRVLGGFGCLAGFQMTAHDAWAASFEMDLGDERRLLNQDPWGCQLRVSSDSGCEPAFRVNLTPPGVFPEDGAEVAAGIREASWAWTVDLKDAYGAVMQRFMERHDPGLSSRAGYSDLVLQLQKCGEEFQAASVMAAPGRCLVPPSPPGPPQH